MSTSTSPANGSPSVTELVSGILTDVQNLGMQHLALFRHEVKQDIRKASDGVSSLAVGLAILQVGALLICLMFVYLLSQMVAGLSLWMCFGIVGAVVIAAGAIATVYGAQKLKSVEKISDETAEIIKDDARWLTQPK